MAAVDTDAMRYRCRRRLLTSLGLIPAVLLTLTSCATTEELYAQYDEQFCPVGEPAPAIAAAISTEVVDRVVIKEVPAAATPTLTWEPAVYFSSDSSKLSRSAKRALDSNVGLLKKFPRHLVAIRGFTDMHSSADYNRQLSQKRIAGVKRYLVKQGIAGTRVVGTSHGESIPLAGQQSAIADNINRRVELMLLDSDGRPLVSHQPVVLGPSD